MGFSSEPVEVRVSENGASVQKNTFTKPVGLIQKNESEITEDRCRRQHGIVLLLFFFHWCCVVAAAAAAAATESATSFASAVAPPAAQPR